MSAALPSFTWQARQTLDLRRQRPPEAPPSRPTKMVASRRPSGSQIFSAACEALCPKRGYRTSFGHPPHQDGPPPLPIGHTALTMGCLPVMRVKFRNQFNPLSANPNLRYCSFFGFKGKHFVPSLEKAFVGRLVQI